MTLGSQYLSHHGHSKDSADQMEAHGGIPSLQEAYKLHIPWDCWQAKTETGFDSPNCFASIFPLQKDPNSENSCLAWNALVSTSPHWESSSSLIQLFVTQALSHIMCHLHS